MRLLASPGNGVAMVKLKNECGKPRPLLWSPRPEPVWANLTVFLLTKEAFSFVRPRRIRPQHPLGESNGWRDGCGKRISFAPPFYTKNDQFTKTGSGRTRGNTQKRDAFLAGNGISAGRYGTAPDITSCNDTGTIRFSNLTARNIDVGDAVFSAYNVVGCEFVPSLS